MNDFDITGCVLLLNFFIIIIPIIIYIPIKIAKIRGIKNSELKTITILSWFGLLFGITWVVALVLALIYQPKKSQIQSTEILLKLNELKEKGIITQKEFEEQKKNLLSSM